MTRDYTRVARKYEVETSKLCDTVARRRILARSSWTSLPEGQGKSVEEEMWQATSRRRGRQGFAADPEEGRGGSRASFALFGSD
jgi:hypothetical protein